MKVQLKGPLDLQILLTAVKENKSQYDREFYDYIDKLHNRIMTLENTLELIGDQTRKNL